MTSRRPILRKKNADDTPPPAGDESQPMATEEKPLDALEAENVALKETLRKKDEEARAAEKARQIERENILLKAQIQATADIGDADIKGGQSLLYPDPTTLDDRWKDPSRQYYWALPEDEGKMVQLRYVKERPPEVKQPDGTITKHPMVLNGHILWSTSREDYDRRKAAERAIGNAAAREAGRNIKGVPKKAMVGRDALPVTNPEERY
jgi:hypothetical protein